MCRGGPLWLCRPFANLLGELLAVDASGPAPPAATSNYGFLGEPLGFKRCKVTSKLAPTYRLFLRFPGFDDEFYEGSEPKTVEEFRDLVSEWETDDRDTDKMVATLEWRLRNPNAKLKP